MGRQSRRKRSSRDIDAARMEELADLDAVIEIDGEPTPVVSPRLGWEGGPEFDREVCLAGVTRFVRKQAEGDWPQSANIPAGVDYVLVTEAAPGIRRRVGLTVVWNHQMN